LGGQVLGQALVAAQSTVTDRLAHSLHAYFLRPGDPKLPILYKVDCIRDGKSFTTRRIVASQAGQAIFNMSVSFHRKEQGFEHQSPMPAAPGPEGLPSLADRARDNKEQFPKRFRENLTCRRPIEVRVPDPLNYVQPQKRKPYNRLWMRTIDTLPANPLIHQSLLAYASDFGLLEASLLPHGVTFIQPDMQVASLDHAMWFHRPLRMDQWLLYVVESPCATAARGLNFGHFYNEQGELVASTAQEGLIRYHGQT